MKRETKNHFETSLPIRNPIDKQPNWIIRWGISIIFVLMVMVVILSRFVNYKESVVVHVRFDTIVASKWGTGKFKVPDVLKDNLRKGNEVSVRVKNLDSPLICKVLGISREKSETWAEIRMASELINRRDLLSAVRDGGSIDFYYSRSSVFDKLFSSYLKYFK